MLRHCAPELVGMAIVGAVSVAIRLRDDRPIVGQDVHEVWSSIKNEWPILITAGTLLSLQALLRLTSLSQLFSEQVTHQFVQCHL